MHLTTSTLEDDRRVGFYLRAMPFLNRIPLTLKETVVVIMHTKAGLLFHSPVPWENGRPLVDTYSTGLHVYIQKHTATQAHACSREVSV